MNSAGVKSAGVVRARRRADGALRIAAPFWVNAVSNFGVIGALMRWRSAPHQGPQLARERFLSALRTGLRHSRNNRQLRAALIRAVGFFFFASCFWALLPLVARDRLRGGATLYGILLGTIGAASVAGVFALPWLKATLGPNRIVARRVRGDGACADPLWHRTKSATAFAASALAGVAGSRYSRT